MKIKKTTMIRTLSFLLLIATSNIFAQHQVTGKLQPIATDGLYKIKLPHTVRSYTETDIRDFRIWDSKGNQVPYFVHTEDTETLISNFSEFKIVSKTNIPDTSATYIFENPNKTIEKAVLLLANYRGSKYFSLEGSNTLEQWFGLVNSQQLYGVNNQADTSVYKVINFPLCSYRYLRIVFNDRNSLPINVLKIGTAATEVIKLVHDEIPVFTTDISELTDTKKTQIHVNFQHPEIINDIHFDIKEPELYNRRVQVYVLKTRQVKHTVETYRQSVTSFTLHADRKAHFSVNSFFGKELYIEIENQDNPILKMSSIRFFQKPLYVVADLKQHESYTISSGDDTLKLPKYDISYFKNRISEALPYANIVSVKLKEPDTIEKPPISFWQHPWFMWGCIGFAGVIIAYFASSLLKDLKNEDH